MKKFYLSLVLGMTGILLIQPVIAVPKSSSTVSKARQVTLEFRQTLEQERYDLMLNAMKRSNLLWNLSDEEDKDLSKSLTSAGLSGDDGKKLTATEMLLFNTLNDQIVKLGGHPNLDEQESKKLLKDLGMSNLLDEN